MNLPVQQYQRSGTHRLVSSRYSQSGTVLEDVATNPDDLAAAAELDSATNERVLGEMRGLAGISPYELVYGIPNAHIIRAAFLHPNKDGGSRFNDTTRGAWYAAEEVETCIREVTYHRSQRLADIIDPEQPEQMPASDIATYDDWQADFHAPFHVLDPEANYAECLQAEPVPQCYQPSQALARLLLTQRCNGILYPSVRRKGARCLVCFRPPLVYNPRRDLRYELRLHRNDGEFSLQVTSRVPEGTLSESPAPRAEVKPKPTRRSRPSFKSEGPAGKS